MSAGTRAAGTGVCAIVVTYHPAPEVAVNLALIAEQVERLVVVDNGSGAAELERLRQAQRELGFELIENGANLGIALALNLGCARAAGAEWLLLFDQDSRLTEGFVAAMLRCAECQAPAAQTALFVPRYYDQRFGHLLPPIHAADGTLAVAMTSGSLLRAATFAQAGPFRDWFIYEIDYEYSLRLRALGHRIVECQEATLLHAPASPQPVRLFGRRLFYTRNYGARTRYYMQRNGQWLRRLYGKAFPEYFAARRRVLWKEYVVVLLAEEDRWSKLAAMLRGLRDGRRLPIPD